MLKQRTLTAAVLTPIAVAIILFLPTSAVALVIAALCLLALWEWTRLAGVQSDAVRIGLLVANIVAFALLWSVRGQPLAWGIIFVGLAWWLLALLWMRHSTYAAAPTRENAVIKMAAGELAVLPAWLALVEIHSHPDQGHAWALLALVLVWVADIAAFFVGKRYGSTKLAPHISPNKTRAGAWGALFGSVAVALIGGWLLDTRGLALLGLVVLAVIAVAASIAGDLFESLLKRQANVKDSGTLFPGHGGLLDRLDSLFSALPVLAVGKLLLDLAFAP